MSYHDEYRQWPFLTPEEFELVCAFFDKRYIRAKLGSYRQIFKIRSRWAATTGASYIQILKLLQLPEDEGDLAIALQKFGGFEESNQNMDIDMISEETDEVRVPHEFPCIFLME
jgi:ubiquitin-like-conjugating enzyme ATG10